MQVESPDRIRNLAIAGHNDTGKTTLTSALLYTGGVVNRQNRVEDGNTTTDFDQEEIDRGISIGLAACYVPWRQTKINLLDSPGYGIFMTEIRSGLRVADAALLCVNAVSGIEVTTEKVWDFAEELGLPVFLHLTKMDRERADWERALEALQERFGRGVLPVQIPLGREESFEGVIDLVHEKAFRYKRDGNGAAEEEDVPGDLASMVEDWRTKLVEAVAETDDGLMEKFFEEGALAEEDLLQGLRSGIRSRTILPVSMSSGLHVVGTSALLDSLVDLAPSPVDRGSYPARTIGGDEVEASVDLEEPARALVFKTLNDPFTGKVSIFRVVSGVVTSDTTMWNSAREEAERVGHVMQLQGKQGENVSRIIAGDIGGVAKLKTTATGDTLTVKDSPVLLDWIDIPEPAISFAIEPKTKGDEEKIGEAVHKLMEEDLSLRSGRDPQTGEFLISGAGQLHVEIAVAKLKKRFKVEVILHPPQVPYRETIIRAADGHGRHKKQTGGRGQFADCKIKLEPMDRGEGYEFADEIFGGAIPQGFRPAVDKGIQEAAARGYLSGNPVVDFRVRLLDGQYHEVDSSEMAFKIAGSLAFKDAMERAKPTILEPIMQVEVTTTDEFTGDIMSDLSQRRGRPQGMDARGNSQVIRAAVPMAEMLNYAPALRSMTQGRSSFTMEFSHYEEVPRNVQEKIIGGYERSKQEEG